ncbi:hypothetical protein Nans01_01750 [Nocardiopsis ansamitocini]|uniref:Uncharacterized protein n=1 Tax=Nocardiopsis ansamitocini TaxID=1670832 RepID=A0A9W6P248_9ACTN|nr:hypothetical protein Nans01_01750 [Nocardiopsis ansamitocini]
MSENLHPHDAGMEHTHDSDGSCRDQVPDSGPHCCARKPDAVRKRLISRSSVPLQRPYERGVNRIEHDLVPFVPMTAPNSPRTPPPPAARS